MYGLDLHPTIDVLVTCSRDSTARVSGLDPSVRPCLLQGAGSVLRSEILEREFQEPCVDPSVPHLVFIPSSVASPCALLGSPAPEVWQVISFTHFLHSVQTGPHSFLVNSHAWIDFVTCLKIRVPVFIDGIVCWFYRFGMWELKPVCTHYLDILMRWLQWGVRLRNHRLLLVWSILFKCTVYSYQHAL